MCFGYFLDSPHWGNSNKYPRYMFYEEIRIKQDLSFLIMKDSLQQQIHLMVTSLVTSAVVVTRVHSICFGEKIKKKKKKKDSSWNTSHIWSLFFLFYKIN